MIGVGGLICDLWSGKGFRTDSLAPKRRIECVVPLSYTCAGSLRELHSEWINHENGMLIPSLFNVKIRAFSVNTSGHAMWYDGNMTV